MTASARGGRFRAGVPRAEVARAAIRRTGLPRATVSRAAVALLLLLLPATAHPQKQVPIKRPPAPTAQPVKRPPGGPAATPRSGDFRARLTIAQRYAQRGQYAEALPLFEALHGESPRDWIVARGLGDCYAALGRFEDAEKLYLAFRTTTGDRRPVIQALEMLHRTAGNRKAAFTDCLDLLLEDPEFLSWSLSEMDGMIDDAPTRDWAAGETERAIAAHPERHDLKLVLSAILVKKGESEKALALVDEADRATRGKGQILFRFASEMEELRQDGLAVQGFQKAAAAAPGIELRAEALERAARIETRRRRYREAVALYAEIARIQPAGPRGRAALLESARLSIGSLRDPAGALAVYERLLATPGLAADQRARVQLGIAGARLRLGDLEKAEQALRSIVSPPADPDDAAEALYRLAEISFFRLDFRTASERYEEAATTYPHSAHANDAIERYVLLFQGEDDANGEPLRLLAALEQAVGKGDLAAATLASDEMAARHPDSILMDDALLALGSAYEEADSVGVAIRTYREIPARFPESRLAPEAQKRIGDLYAGALGDFKQALVEYEALLTRWPMSLQAGEMRGTVLRLRRKNAS